MFRERLMSSLVIVPVVAGAFYLGGPYFLVFVSLVAVLAALEYRQLIAAAGIEVPWLFVAVAAAVSLSGYLRSPGYIATLCGGAVVLLSTALSKTGSAPSAMYSLSGEMYIGGLLGALALLRAGPGGRTWALFTLLCTWATDVGAYLGGVAFGRHKLAPAISPGKTWEGAVSGLVCSVAAGAALAKHLGLPVQFAAISGAVMGLLAELGDLVESSLKRFAKVKDSGKIIPGHGGILDRFDSLLFTGAGGLLIRALYYLVFR